MGLEVDLTLESKADLETLSAAINLHKKYRTLIHSGDYFRVDSGEGCDTFGIIDRRKNEALFSHTPLQSKTATLPSVLFFEGLNLDKSYRLSLIWPENFSTTTASIVDEINSIEQPFITSGAALQEHGLQLPLAHPNTVLIFHLLEQD